MYLPLEEAMLGINRSTCQKILIYNFLVFFLQMIINRSFWISGEMYLPLEEAMLGINRSTCQKSIQYTNVVTSKNIHVRYCYKAFP